MRCLGALVGLVLAMSACGGTASHARHIADDSSAGSSGPDVRSMVLPDANLIVYFNLEDIHGVAPTILEGFTELGETSGDVEEDDGEVGFVARVARDCDINLDEDVREVMISVLPNKSFAVAARLDRPGQTIVDCLARQGNERTKLGETAGVVADDITVIAVGDVVVAGNSEELELAADGTPPRWVQRVATFDDALASTHLVVNSAGLWMISMTLERAEGHTHFVTSFRGTKASDADLMVDTFRATAADVAKEVASNWGGKERKQVRRWLRQATIRRTVFHGAEVRLALPDESGERLEQRTRAAKMLARSFGSRVDRKHSELSARAMLWNIAERLTSYADAHKTGWHKMPSFPVSAPLTPSDVPRGENGSTSEDDWKHATWKSIDFSMLGERRYSYEIVTTPDRKHATVRALADQDGDGERQVLSLSLAVSAKGRVFTEPYITVQNPLD